MVKMLKAIHKFEKENNRHPNRQLKLAQRAQRSVDVTVTETGWLSPKYTKSRHTALNWKSVEANRCVGLIPHTPANDSYKVLRTQIQQHMREKGWNTLMVTSIHPGEGKTVTTINLAALFAKEFDQTVLLVDADLRHQSINQYLGLDSNIGLADHLLGDCSVQEMIIWPQVEKLCLVSGRRKVHESTEILNSPRMRGLVQEMKRRYTNRLIFFDVPSILGTADAIAFAKVVDAIIIVVAHGKTMLPDIQHALTLIPQEKFIGFIMNKQL